MKRTPVIVTLAGMAALAVTGTALAAAADDGASPLTGLGSAVPTATPSFTSEPTPDDSATSTKPPLAGDLGAPEARRIALAKVGGGTVTEIESEFEHGFATWKVEIVRAGVEHDVYVDRATGEIVKLDSDDDKGGDRGGHGGRGHGSDD